MKVVSVLSFKEKNNNTEVLCGYEALMNITF